MRKKLSEEKKRNNYIGVKVRSDIKSKIKFISDREARPMSTQINIILEEFVESYLSTYKIDWAEYAQMYKEEY